MHCLNHHDNGGDCEEKIKLTSDVSLWFNEFPIVWHHIAVPLLDATLDVPTTLAHVAKQSPRQADIGLGVCIDLEV
jgi:hypothetical protein